MHVCFYVIKLKNHHPDASDLQLQVGMQRKKSLERLHNNGDVLHGGWNEHVAGSVNCMSVLYIQAWCHYAQMSAWQGFAVPCRLLHAGHRCCWRAASQVGHTANDGGDTTSAFHCWPPTIHRARPRGLECLAGRPPHTAGL